jgi:hypothetical protein
MRSKLSSRPALATLVAAVVTVSGAAAISQPSGAKESFTAVAVVSNNLASGAGTVLIDVTRWSTPAETEMLAQTLMQKGPQELLSQLQQQTPTGTIRTPDSLAYELRFAHQAPDKDGGRRIVLATDRPIGFWEARSGSRTLEYPFTVIQMQLGRDGKGTGTLSYATKVTASGNVIQLENFATAPVMLTQIETTSKSR